MVMEWTSGVGVQDWRPVLRICAETAPAEPWWRFARDINWGLVACGAVYGGLLGLSLSMLARTSQ